MTKYIIENCPCYINDYWNFEACKNGSTVNGTYITRCNSVDDCLLKQIVEKCKGAQKTQWVKNKKKPYSPSKAAFAREILNILEIEEVK